jgi:hypothetical protein
MRASLILISMKPLPGSGFNRLIVSQLTARTGPSQRNTR